VSFKLKRVARETVCLTLVATDDRGASATRSKSIMILNRAPAVEIELVTGSAPPRTLEDGRYELYSSFRVHAKTSDPQNDPVTLDWTLTPPGGPAKPMPSCPDKSPSDGCFDADAPGAYLIAADASDGYDAAPPASRTLLVAPDRPPCLIASPDTFKLSEATDKPVKLSAVVDDDGDPYPPRSARPGAMSQFVWSMELMGVLKAKGGLFQPPELVLPANEHRPGDLVHVRLQYLDRVDLTGGRDYSSCDPMALGNCALKPGCYQWVTWTVQYY
jgi:hypothetical protein